MYRDIFLNHIPASTHRTVVAIWSPVMVTAPLLQMGKFLPGPSATSTLNHLRDITHGILWRVFEKQMHMIRVYCHINNLNIKFLTGLPDYRFRQHSHIANQHLAPVPGRKNHVARKHRYSMPLVLQFLRHGNCGCGCSVRINGESIVKVLLSSPLPLTISTFIPTASTALCTTRLMSESMIGTSMNVAKYMSTTATEATRLIPARYSSPISLPLCSSSQKRFRLSVVH